jgi:hypothetical protein
VSLTLRLFASPSLTVCGPLHVGEARMSTRTRLSGPRSHASRPQLCLPFAETISLSPEAGMKWADALRRPYRRDTGVMVGHASGEHEDGAGWMVAGIGKDQRPPTQLERLQQRNHIKALLDLPEAATSPEKIVPQRRAHTRRWFSGELRAHTRQTPFQKLQQAAA